MKNKLYLIAVLLLISNYSLFGQKPMEEDPYLLWQTNDPMGYSGFIIHPNGNIIANRGAEIFELDGNTGQVVKAFPVFVGTDINTMDVTKDGKILGAGFGNIILYDLENDTVIGGVSETNGLFAFFPDNKRFIARSTKLPPNNLLIYNIETKERTEIGINYVPWAIATSSDGKYFATGGTTKEQVGLEEKTFVYLRLWDAQTLKPIKELGKFEGNNEVRSIKFSPDGKYVGYQVQYDGIYVYKIQDLNFNKHYNSLNVEIYPLAFTFLNSDMISFISLQLNEKERFISIQSIDNDIVRYRYLGKTGFGMPAYSFLTFNSFNNSLVLNGGHLFAFDINKMITTVEESPNKSTLSVSYNKNTLIVTGLISISGQINITISDISGKVVRKLNSPVINTELRIPLKLPNGTYLIHIQDGSQEYTSKFLVVE